MKTKKILKLIIITLTIMFASGFAGCDNTAESKTTEKEIMILPEDWERRAETYTYYQTGSYFNMQTDCQTDGVKVCIFYTKEANEALVQSFKESPLPKSIETDFSAAQDTGRLFIDGMFDGKTHYDTVIKKKDGSDWQFGLLPGLPYILPTKEWNDYIASKLIDGIDFGATAVTMQELGVFGDTGYEQAFRDEWKNYYGTEWPDTLWSDPGHYYMGQDLRNYMAKRQVEQVFKAIKNYKSSVKTIFSNHTSPSYYGFYNSVGNHDIMALDVVDGVEGQSWSNTIMLPFKYDGKTEQRPFVTAFSEYSYWSVLGRQFPDKEIYVITDPKGDGFNGPPVIPLEKCGELYRHQIVSQLAFSDIYRYNTVVWPDRAMSRGGSAELPPVSTDAFNTVICNIVSLQANMYKYQDPIITENQPLKTGVMLLDSMCYPAGGPKNPVTYESFFNSFAGLFYNGVIVESIPAGREKSQNDVLKSYDLIIVSYDLMKPQNTLVNEELAEYVKNGGIILFLSGQAAYEDLDSSWWKQAGLFCPLDDLFSRVGIQSGERKTNLRSALLTPSDANLAKAIGEFNVSGSRLIGYENAGNAAPIYYGDDGGVIAFEKAYGSGHFYYFGIDPSFFGETGKGGILFDIVKAIAAETKSVSIISSGSISYRRGPIYGFFSLSGDCTTEQGKFIDMFDSNLSVVYSLTVPQGQSALLYDVSKKLSGKNPGILFAQGNNPALYESKKQLRVVTAGPSDTFGCIRVYLPGGKDSAEITAVNGDGKNVLVSYDYDETSGTMLITYNNDVLKVIVDVIPIAGDAILTER